MISKRDQRLLLILLILLVLILPFIVLIKPLRDKTSDLKNENQLLEEDYEQLMTLEQEKETYLSQDELFLQEEDELVSHFTRRISQINTILFMKELEDNIGIDLYQVGFSKESDPQILGGTLEEEGMTTSESLMENLQSVSTSTNFTFQSSYSEFKQLLNYIKEYEYRTVIPNFSITYNQDQSTLTGTFTMIQYGLEGSNIELTDYEIPEVEFGTDNIFSANASESGSYEDDESQDYDMFLVLAQPTADTASKILGLTSDPSAESYLQDEENDQKEIRIRFYQEEDKYFVTYGMDEEEKTEQVDPGEKMILVIFSTQRLNEQDYVSADLILDNETDMTFYVSVRDDDEENSRVLITGKTGDIKISQ